MVAKRKYITYKIDQLEEVFESSAGDLKVLKSLEDELKHRKTKRSKKLRKTVKAAKAHTQKAKPIPRPASTAKPNRRPSTVRSQEPSSRNTLLAEHYFGVDIDEPENRGSKQENRLGNETRDSEKRRDEPLLSKPDDILDAWITVETFSPQTYRYPKDLAGSGSVAYLEDHEPWFKGEKSRPRCNLYYVIYLGSIDLKRATTKLLEIYQDERTERPSVNGNVAIGAILVNKNGVPVADSGVAIASFGWAYGQALSGNLERVKSWETVEAGIFKELDRHIYRTDEEGNEMPLTIDQVNVIYDRLVRGCVIPSEDVTKPSFAIRLYQPFSKGEPEVPLLNSFFLSDLQWAKNEIHSKTANKTISRYLGTDKPIRKIDLLTNKEHIEEALQPKYTPFSRWPGKGRHHLVLLQQAAVNLAKRELEKEGLFSVNGPPGTGKTTLLRDVVAFNVLNRAVELYSFTDVDKAFEHAGQIKMGRGFVHLYKLDKKLIGHEVLVASSNNKAVENISKELPLTSNVETELFGKSYFKTVSDSLAEENEDTWGLIAAVLGNAENRGKYTNKVWWDEQTGLMTYFKAISGQVSRDPEDYEDGIVPPVIRGCGAPIDHESAIRNWKTARRNFKKALNEATRASEVAQKAYVSYLEIQKLESELSSSARDLVALESELLAIQKNYDELSQRSAQAESYLEECGDDEEGCKRGKPGLIRRMFFRTEWRAWNVEYEDCVASTAEAKKARDQAHIAHEIESGKQVEAQSRVREARANIEKITNRLSLATSNIEAASDTCEGALVTNKLWSLSHKEQQLHTPVYSDQAHYLRDKLFVSSMELHKAFIDVAAKQMRQNLSAFFYVLSNGKLPDKFNELIPHLWSTAFLLTPVISTTFASVSRMLKRLPASSIGWLLIDEAGQAIPQAAVGAMMRSQKVLAVGDPLQIEPVVTLPLSLVDGILRHYKVDPFNWGAPYVSVQSLSDRANEFGTSIDRGMEEIRIGAPLLVHRRCEEPMFDISNKLAYNKKMVSATPARDSELTGLFGAKACWFDIRGRAEEKWCPEEGDYVAKMLLNAVQKQGENVDLYVITPFRIVAGRMRRRMLEERTLLVQNGIVDPESWVSENIGTIHTFQGREAQGVIMILGAQSPAQIGARKWATSNVNLLNVAVSRAKQNLYVVGNKALWGDLGNMKIVRRRLG